MRVFCIMKSEVLSLDCLYLYQSKKEKENTVYCLPVTSVFNKSIKELFVSWEICQT